MTTNRVVIQCNVKKLEGFADKPYDCVAAVPIASRDRAFGAITVDSKESRTFDGQEGTNDRVLRPVAAALLLTRKDDDPACDCAQRDIR